ncbi:peptidylprolyl isomerase, partial [Chloroflexota bacterium]
MEANKVQKGVVVSIEYILKLDDGEMLDETSGDPLLYLHGADNIVPGLEQALEGMALHEQKNVTVKPDGGYGVHDPEDIDTVPRSVFPPEVELDEGVMITLQDEEGNIFDATVLEVTEEDVTMDFNHPLAGETLHFAVTIVGLRPATP